VHEAVCVIALGELDRLRVADTAIPRPWNSATTIQPTS